MTMSRSVLLITAANRLILAHSPPTCMRHDDIALICCQSTSLESRTFVRPLGPLHMHKRIIMAHNVVTEIQKILTCVKVDTPITFGADMSSITTCCTGCIQMTYKPIQYVHLNPFSVWQVSREETCRGKSVRDEQPSISWSETNLIERQL